MTQQQQQAVQAAGETSDARDGHDKVEPIAPHRAARRADSPDLLSALGHAMAASQMASQDHVLLGPEASQPRRLDGEPEAEPDHRSEAEVDDRQLDLLPQSA